MVPACRGSVSTARHNHGRHEVFSRRHSFGFGHHTQVNGTAPAPDKYAALKKELLQLYQLSDMERADRLLSLTGLGDSRPELMENMLALLGSGDTSFIFTHLFLRQLPPSVRTVLANSPLIRTKDYRGLAALE